MEPTPPGSSTLPRIHGAELGRLGAVVRGRAVDFQTAVNRRRAGEDVLVCGENLADNRRLAREIEEEIGPSLRHDPHTRHAGNEALPHFQQRLPPPGGHTFYETPNRRSRTS